MIKSSMQGDQSPRQAQVLRFRKGEPVYYEGDAATAWYTVAEGVIRTCRFHADGHRQITGFHYLGDVFGTDNGLHRESAEAVTDVSLWCLPALGDAATGHREKGLRIALENAQRSIAIFGRRSAPERLAAFLIATGDRLGAVDMLELPMCRTDIADFLGLTIHTVSRTMSQLCDEGLIVLEGPQRCRMRDREGLRRLAGDTV